LYGEALSLVSEGIASVEEVDRIVTKSGGFKSGPFALLDTAGLDTDLALSEAMYERTYHNSRFRPSAMEKQMVEAGLYGKKSKKGFYNYEAL
jgi:3-hydroxybutyryl-CoA dehydrogenase